MARAYVGISGWNYPSWKDDFYAGVPRQSWLAHCGEHFSGIEVNGTFYRQQPRSTFEKWRAAVPERCSFAVKGNRYLTHNKKLADPRGPLQRERAGAEGLGDQLSAVLWQLPATWRRDLERLERFASTAVAVWPVRHALELRHPSWFDGEVLDCLARHGLAVCLSDSATWPLWDAVTADFVYVRLHGHSRTYASRYSTPHLVRWAGRVRGWLDSGRDVHVYFDNDAEGHAPWDALRLLDLLG
jgi:uncharacterized protein YecE (DUF72 family)